MPEEERGSTTEELTSEQQRDNVIRLAFGGSHDRFNEFVSIVREAIPPATGVVLRGSAVTGERWKDGLRSTPTVLEPAISISRSSVATRSSACTRSRASGPTWAPHVRLDYFFTPAGFSSRIRACDIVNHSAAAAASDHLPLLAEVDFV